MVKDGLQRYSGLKINTFSAKVCPSRLLNIKINFSTLAYIKIRHLENRKKSFLPKIMQIRKKLVVITLLMHEILIIEFITITNS